jgi:cell division protein FtsQ
VLGRNRYRRNSAIRRMKKARFRRSCLNVLAGMLGVALMSLFFVFCHDIVLQNLYFKITSLEVFGNKRLSVKEILEAARISPENTTLQINLSLAGKYLLSHPWIASARLTRELPGRITVSVTEHHPLAVLDMGKKFLINTDGKMFKEVAESEADELPVIEGFDYSDLEAGNIRRSPNYDAVLSLMAMGQNPTNILSGQKIRLIRVDKEAGISLYLSMPIQTVKVNAIKFGYQDYTEKFIRLEKVISYFKANKQFQGIDWVDLRQLNRIVVNPLVTEPASDGHKEI